MHPLANLDLQYLWHPFTQMRDWLKREPIVIQSAKGAFLTDVHGRRYLDANASIWTNLHGHAHPAINRAICEQLGKVAHTSALGLANEPASLLGERLVKAANGTNRASKGADQRTPLLGDPLARVFYSDNGSTALEVALKLAYEYTRRTGRAKRPRFLALEGAYHGDTVGAVSLGHIDLFHRAYQHLLFPTDAVMAPYCYRCPHNRAKPAQGDARDYRKCRWECVDQVEEHFRKARKAGRPFAAMVLEPLMQGAAGMVPQPSGWLRKVAEIVRSHDALLIADEVMTGFGRTSSARPPEQKHAHSNSLFACHKEGVQPDFLCVAKGMTGGYLPMAATLTTQRVFDAFLGEYEEFKTFFHGHSFTGNQLGSAAALASLDLLETRHSLLGRRRLAMSLEGALAALCVNPFVGDIRQVGLLVGVELVQDWRTRRPFPLEARVGIRVSEAMTRRGVITRPVGNVIVLMPPYCMKPSQIERVVEVLAASIHEVLR